MHRELMIIHSVMKIVLAFLILFNLGLAASDWPSGLGPHADGTSEEVAPTTWSVVHNQNIRWQKNMPESGQSSVAIVGNRLFYSYNKPVTKTTELSQDIIACCADASTGELLWERTITATNPLRISGCFGDSTSPAAVCDGNNVVFTNASGKIACFSLAGEIKWEINALANSRPEPFLIGTNFIYNKQTYLPESGHFSHKHANAPLEEWTQLQAIDITTGKPIWTSTCGVNMGSISFPQNYGDDNTGIVVGRGGGHGPPEKPEGVSLIDGKTGETKWSVTLDKFMATQSYPIRHNQVLVFHDKEHLWIDAKTGEISRRVDISKDVTVCAWDGEKYVDSPAKITGKGRYITQQSDLCVGDYRYFRAYQQTYLGRIHVMTGAVEYLQLPVQLIREAGQTDKKIWSLKEIVPSNMTNNNGFEVMGDKRSRTNTWGHVASPLMTAFGDHLYVTTMNGTIYVIRHAAERLDENAVVAINDLGPAGDTWTRASLTASNGFIYAHTLRSLICIGPQ